jgi:formylmethanofuran dehydrogenase subunit E
MANTEIKFQLFRVTGPDTGYQVGELFNSEAVAKNHALFIKDREAQEYKINAIITTRSTLDIFTVPAHVPNLEEIAQDIIDGSNGSFYMEWGDDFEFLNKADQAKVEDMVHEEISNCAGCGWHWSKDSMENIDGDELCYKCAEDAANEEDEDEDED